jgi:phage terminase large subunit-like protein
VHLGCGIALSSLLFSFKSALPVENCRTGLSHLAASTAELKRLVISRALRHGGHPVLRWNASNVAVRQDPAANLKPDKERSRERIDGVSALVNALGRALLRDRAGTIYAGRGLFVVGSGGEGLHCYP